MKNMTSVSRISNTLRFHSYQKWPFRGRVRKVKKVKRSVNKEVKTEVTKVKKVKVQSGAFCCLAPPLPE